MLTLYFPCHDHFSKELYQSNLFSKTLNLIVSLLLQIFHDLLPVWGQTKGLNTTLDTLPWSGPRAILLKSCPNQ